MRCLRCPPIGPPQRHLGGDPVGGFEADLHRRQEVAVGMVAGGERLRIGHPASGRRQVGPRRLPGIRHKYRVQRLGVAHGRQDERGKRDDYDEEEGEPSGQECMLPAGRGGYRC